MASLIINNQADNSVEENVEVVTQKVVTETKKLSPEDMISELLYRKYKEIAS